MMKLSKEQIRVYKGIVEDIKRARKCNSVEEYYVELETYSQKYRNDYDELVKFYTNRFYEYNLESIYKKYYENSKYRNISITRCSSATLKALEKRGLIRVIRDGRFNCDVVELIKEMEVN